jgi:hypothetical protein
MKKPSTKMIALQLERREMAASQALANASEHAEARIIAALEAIRPVREKFWLARSERAAFIAGQVPSTAVPVSPDHEAEQISANLSLSAFATALNAQTSAAPDKTRNGAARP